jgi:hypothetical protein
MKLKVFAATIACLGIAHLPPIGSNKAFAQNASSSPPSPLQRYAIEPTSRKRAISERGGAPNRRRYSRLNCEELS